MIIITGGAGMIGSMIAWQLNQQGRDDLLIVDDIQHEDQWQNLVKRRYLNYLDKSELACFLAGKPKVDAIIHMGAISATVERDFNKLVQNNIRFSQLLWV
jgi:ADP-L-glycero-D-manno-heptose 6-epimerase